MKKIIFLLIFSLFIAAAGQAARLNKVRLGFYPDKLRAAFDFDSAFTYALEESKEKITIHLQKTEASPDIQNYIDVSDMIVKYFEVEKDDAGLKITIPLAEPVPYNIFSLSDPDRLVIDFDRAFTNVVSGGTIIDGVEHLIVSKGSEKGRVNAHVLKIDPGKADVYPALARKNKPNVLESFVNAFNPWKETGADPHFFRARVGQIAEEQRAVAAVNGTYFAYTGKPLGSLLIDRELVSTPIYDRTALILAEDRKTYIDNVIIDCYFLTARGVRYEITGVNQGRDGSAIILYTPAWGEQTGSDEKGVELVIAGQVVKEIRPGNSNIPQDGYVISISGPAAQFIGDNVKAGDRIDLHIKIIPFAVNPGPIRHMVSGGPRLLKNGVVYVSKNEEKFKSDIARGRAARTAVGVTKEGKLLLVTVDGLPREKSARGDKSSLGVTLEELANLMISLGAVEAMNLDGGGSTTMWIDGTVVNRPATGYEQKVSNAIVVGPR